MKGHVILKNVSKQYTLHNAHSTLLSLIASPLSPKNKPMSFSINEISLTVNPTDRLGLIGRNGCGKTTILKLIANMTTPDSGYIEVDGKVLYLSNIYNGLNVKLSLKENVYLIASLLGVPRKDIHTLFPKVLAFSELERFKDSSVLHFSRGMIARLSFSATMLSLEFIKPDILLLDEVLGGGGDKEFKIKSKKKMHQIIKKIPTVIIVSHSDRLIDEFCNKKIVVKNGILKTPFA